MEWRMKRLFNRRQRQILAWIAGGKCMECNQSLAESFHADHIIAHANGGQTIIKNGQALCAGCNLKKGSK